MGLKIHHIFVVVSVCGRVVVIVVGMDKFNWD